MNTSRRHPHAIPYTPKLPPSPSTAFVRSPRSGAEPLSPRETYRFLAPFIDNAVLRRLLPLPIDAVQRRTWLRGRASGRADFVARLEARQRVLRWRLGATSYLQLATLPLVSDVDRGHAAAWHHVIARPDDDLLLDSTRLRHPNQTTPLLTGFSGYLHVCDRSLGRALAKRYPGLTPVGCWGQVRQECLAAYPDEPKAVRVLLRLIDRLLACEDEADAAGLSPVQRWQLRQTVRRPLARLHRLATGLLRQALPGSRLHTACAHLLRDWDVLARHLDTGETRLVNDLAETCLPLATIAKRPLTASATSEAILAWGWVLSTLRLGRQP